LSLHDNQITRHENIACIITVPRQISLAATAEMAILIVAVFPSRLSRYTYDGHTLREAIENTQKLTGCAIERGYVDKGYRGHDTENPRRIFISGQKRGVFGVIKRELRRRSAIEPVIGHLKAEGHLGRCYLKGRAGDAANAILSAVGYNFRRILAWLRVLLRQILSAILRVLISQSALIPAS
jgi:IS5 family transposase